MAEWGGYGAIIAEAREDERAAATDPLVLCPLCGNVLTRSGRGLNCDVGHFLAPAGATVGGS